MLYTGRVIAKEIPQLNSEEMLKFIDSIEFSTSCWNWKRSKNWAGYGDFSFKSKSYPAHRVSYEFFNKKKIPTDMVIDHLCKNTSCVNPTHLDVVTLGENTRRGNGISSVNRIKTHCIHGHPFSGENLVFRYKHRKGKDVVYRVCRICKSIKQKKWMDSRIKKEVHL